MQPTDVIWRLTCLLFALSLAACSSTQHTETGFLSNYEQLQTSQQFSDTRVYIAEGFDGQALAKFNKVYIAPFEVWLDKDRTAAVGSSNLQNALSYLNQRLHNAISPYYDIVTQPAPDVLTIRGAITRVEITEPELSPTDFIPFRVVLNAGNAAYLAATSQQDLITQVGIEMEFSTSNPREVLFAMTAVREMDTTVLDNEGGNAQAVKQVFDEWADNFAKRLSKINEPSK